MAEREGAGSWPEEGFSIALTPLKQPYMLPDVLYPFAWDEALCRKVGAGQQGAAAHIWRHPAALVLGLRDRRLPRAEQAMAALRGAGLSVAVRNSGGAAVPLDSGVVNLSLIFPYAQEGKMDFHAEFRMMAELIAEAAGEWTSGTRAGEVEGAYCPGEYDLSIGGRKFCGIAQRRQLRAYVVSAFIVVEGSGTRLGQVAREFYRLAAGEAPHGDGLQVLPETMASLQELAGVPSADAFVEALIWALQRKGGRLLDDGVGPRSLLPDEEAVAMMEELRRRYDS